MDRQAFKQRMQNLKSYRENNPGKGYWDWKKAIQNYKGIDIDNDPTYDYYGFYKENPQTAKDILNDSEDAHFTDTYKTSVHPTFSNESKYSGYVNKYNPKGITGGYWGEDNSYNFSDSQIKNNWDVHDTLRYLEDAENYGVTAKYKNMYPKDVDNTIYGGVLPQVEIKAQVFAEGGEIGDKEKEKFYQITGRSSSGRPLEQGLKPVFSLEDAANMTPIGDAISAKDAYDAVKNRDWLGAGLAAVTMIPFVPTTVRNFRKKYKGVTPKREIPTVNKKAIDNAIDEAKNYRDSRIKLYQQAIEDRNASYERLIENEDALRRAVNFDKKYGTNYVKTYTKQLQNYAKSKNSPDLMQIGIKPMGANGSFDPNIPDYVFINSDYVKNGKLQPGLISHEKSHYDNQKAGALSLPIFDNRFVDTKKTKTMYPKTYDWIQRYLHNFEETKSHMNEFRTNMINKNLLKPDSKVGLKQIKDLIFNSDNDNMKKLFNTYKSKRQFVKDFNSVPITSIGDNKTLV